LCELYKDLDIVTDIKSKRLKWVGHVVRLDQQRVVKIVFESKPEGRKELQDLNWDGWKMMNMTCGS
jgi:hypothetical protein